MNAALPANRIQLVDENNAWRLAFGLLEQIANTRRSDSNKHLHEIASAERKEWNTRFSSDGFRQQRFSCPRWTNEKHSFRNLGSQRLVALGVLQKIDHLLQFVFGFIAAGHIGKAHAGIPVGYQFGAAFPKTED